MNPRFLLVLFCSWGAMFAQAPSIAWQKLVGGNSSDFFRRLTLTTDGGYFLAGKSGSNISGDKTEDAFNSYDYWVVKLDSNRNIEWQRTLGGETTDSQLGENLKMAIQTADGGYLVGGTSDSPVSGNKTEACRGSYDYWLVKLDANGVTQWEKAYGGNLGDDLADLKQTTDGGYMLAGSSSSPISGEKTENSHGGSDIWVIKIDAVGTIEWQKTIGGSGADGAATIELTADGGYFVGGNSTSPISGDKTENSYGSMDYWVIKLNNLGSIEWQKTIGGANIDEIYATTIATDGGYCLTGRSTSGISGLKTENCRGISDYWIVKISGSGALEWQKTLGGDEEDIPYSIIQCPDDGYSVTGSSASAISGDRTEASYGGYDAWIVRLNEAGNLLWQKSIGGAGQDGDSTILQAPDGGFILGGGSGSSNSGNVTVTGNGQHDYWILKLEPEVLAVPQHFFAGISVYPNPTAGVITVRFGELQHKISVGVVNILGQHVYSRDYENVEMIQDLAVEGAAGVYFITMENDNGTTAVFKIVKQQG